MRLAPARSSSVATARTTCGCTWYVRPADLPSACCFAASSAAVEEDGQRKVGEEVGRYFPEKAIGTDNEGLQRAQNSKWVAGLIALWSARLPTTAATVPRVPPRLAFWRHRWWDRDL